MRSDLHWRWNLLLVLILILHLGERGEQVERLLLLLLGLLLLLLHLLLKVGAGALTQQFSQTVEDCRVEHIGHLVAKLRLLRGRDLGWHVGPVECVILLNRAETPSWRRIQRCR